MVTFACIPFAVIVGVLRYRLLGIEVVLRRTLLYAPLTLLVALVVGGLTTALARLVPEGPLPLLVASAVVAVLVIPVAGRLRPLVDRLVLGERADPLDPRRPGRRRARGRARTTRSPRCWKRSPPPRRVVRRGARRRRARWWRRWANRGRNARTFPLRHGGERARRAERRVRDAASRGSRTATRDSCSALAPHLAVVVGSRRLTEELARERKRVVAATLAERDRLRRDLHDGLGPSLSGIALGLRGRRAPPSTAIPMPCPTCWQRTRPRPRRAVREIRRVLDGLRPSALDARPRRCRARDRVRARPRAARDAALRARDDALPLLRPHGRGGGVPHRRRVTDERRRGTPARSHCRVRLSQANGDAAHPASSDDGTGIARRWRRSGHGLDSMRTTRRRRRRLLSVASSSQPARHARHRRAAPGVAS